MSRFPGSSSGCCVLSTAIWVLLKRPVVRLGLMLKILSILVLILPGTALILPGSVAGVGE
jgi:hypothetical protein